MKRPDQLRGQGDSDTLPDANKECVDFKCNASVHASPYNTNLKEDLSCQ